MYKVLPLVALAAVTAAQSLAGLPSCKLLSLHHPGDAQKNDAA